MKKGILSIILLFTVCITFAQISFEKGYYINNSGERVDCLIKNLDWNNNPDKFDYKLSETDQPKTITIQSVREFGVDNFSKYSRATVQIDYSRVTLNVDFLSKKREPEYKEETVFLKVLIEGNVSLYEYKTGRLIKFFYSINGSNITPLIYKNYVINGTQIKTNNRYKQQLSQLLVCTDLATERFEKLNYSKRSLIKLFKDYGECKNFKLTSIKRKKRDLFSVSIRPRVENYAQLYVSISSNPLSNYTFKEKLGYGIGLDLEYILPFNKNKWAVTIEPTFRSFKSSEVGWIRSIFNANAITLNAERTSVDIPFGIRHYFFLNDNSKLFAAFYYAFEVNLKSEVDFLSQGQSFLKLKDKFGKGTVNLGIGYKYLNKYNIEIRYNQGRDLVFANSSRFAKFESGQLSLAIGYTLF